jgi:flavin-dependent dehydrogenase/polyisoprenoid-binding protein YceI
LSSHFDTDVFVAGGGPAGLAAAIAARRKGFRVTLADCSIPPIDKACGEGLMPDAQVALHNLGIQLHPAEGFPFRGIRFLDGALCVDASFPHGQGIGMRRILLHQKMVQHAAAVGVNLLWGQRVSGIDGDLVRVGDITARARWIVGADGSASPVRRWSGLDRMSRIDSRFGFRLHYRVAPWTDCMEVYWGPGCQIYITPIGPQDICVALISRDKQLRLDRALGRFPEVLEKLNGAKPIAMERGAVSAMRQLKAVHRGRIALVGDASGSVDAITGEGICLGLQQGLALASALAAGDLAQYQAEHKLILRRPTFMARTMLLMENRARMRRRVLRAMSSSPRIFAGMLAMHVGAASPSKFAANGIELGWRMLAGSLTAVALLLTCAASVPSLHAETLVLDPARSTVEFTLGDALHTVHGTFKLKSGIIHFDPGTGQASGSVVVDATTGESGSGARDKRMHKNILESGSYPEIVFTPDGATGKLSTDGTAAQVQVHGMFRIHGADHQMTLPFQVRNVAGQITATTQFSVPYVNWGMKNPSTFLIKVNDAVEIGIRATGRLSDSTMKHDVSK